MSIIRVCLAILAPFLHSQIEEDLNDIKITRDQMEATWLVQKTDPSCIRYKCVDGVLTSSASNQVRAHPRYIVVTEALEKIFASQPCNVDFLVSFQDALFENASPAPIFTFAKKQGAKRLILIPDCEALNPRDRLYLTKLMLEGGRKIPWSQKKEMSFWRGSPTGTGARFRLVNLSEKRPSSLDATFISGKMRAVNPKDHLLYKYLIDVDGNSCCYSRTFWILLSNSLMLKQVTDHIQWFYKGLIPFVHFIPLDSELTDLEEKITYCQKNEEKAQEIIKQANDLAMNHLQYEENLAYLREVLKTYASRLQYKPMLEKEDLKAHVPLYRKIYFELKGYLRKRLKSQPVASRGSEASALSNKR